MMCPPRREILFLLGDALELAFTHKFGCDAEMAIDLLIRAKALGLRPAGVSFHVGSQQTDPLQWDSPIEHAEQVSRACARAGVELDLLNLGGGFPGRYRFEVPSLATYAETIEDALDEHFGSSRPRIIIEPGRYLVAFHGAGSRGRVYWSTPLGSPEDVPRFRADSTQ